MLLLGVFLINFASVSAAYQIDTEINLTVVCLNNGYCSNESFCNINIENPQGDLIVTGQNMTSQGSFYNYTINNTFLREHKVTGFCKDGEDSKEIDFTYLVTYTGEDVPVGFDGRFILLLFFTFLIVMLVYLQRQINFNKWYQGILSKYNHRNFFRTFISKLGFFFMNNPYSLFYMIGLFIMLMLYDITRVYVLESAYNVMEVLVMIYLFAMFFLFIELLGDIHEFFSKIAEDIKAMGWGMSGDSGLLDTNKIGGGK